MANTGILNDISMDDKVGLATCYGIGSLTIAIGELIVAAKAAKSDLGTVTKWFTITALASNAVSLMRYTKELWFGTAEKPVEEEEDEEETEEVPEEIEPEKVEET